MKTKFIFPLAAAAVAALFSACAPMSAGKANEAAEPIGIELPSVITNPPLPPVVIPPPDMMN